jgi:hypothetical protein
MRGSRTDKKFNVTCLGDWRTRDALIVTTSKSMLEVAHESARPGEFPARIPFQWPSSEFI